MKILGAIDDSQFSEASLRAVQSQFDPKTSGVPVLHALDLFIRYAGRAPVDPTSLERILEDERRAAEALVKRAKQSLQAAGFQAQSATQKGDARSVILDVASSWQPDLIVLESRGRIEVLNSGALTRFGAGGGLLRVPKRILSWQDKLSGSSASLVGRPAWIFVALVVSLFYVLALGRGIEFSI